MTSEVRANCVTQFTQVDKPALRTTKLSAASFQQSGISIAQVVCGLRTRFPHLKRSETARCRVSHASGFGVPMAVIMALMLLRMIVPVAVVVVPMVVMIVIVLMIVMVMIVMIVMMMIMPIGAT